VMKVGPGKRDREARREKKLISKRKFTKSEDEKSGQNRRQGTAKKTQNQEGEEKKRDAKQDAPETGRNAFINAENSLKSNNWEAWKKRTWLSNTGAKENTTQGERREKKVSEKH